MDPRQGIEGHAVAAPGRGIADVQNVREVRRRTGLDPDGHAIERGVNALVRDAAGNECGPFDQRACDDGVGPGQGAVLEPDHVGEPLGGQLRFVIPQPLRRQEAGLDHHPHAAPSTQQGRDGGRDPNRMHEARPKRVEDLPRTRRDLRRQRLGREPGRHPQRMVPEAGIENPLATDHRRNEDTAPGAGQQRRTPPHAGRVESRPVRVDLGDDDPLRRPQGTAPRRASSSASAAL
jgi:hypothetical protein